MDVVIAPNLAPIHTGMPRVFLAGGITGCPDWQQEIISMLYDTRGQLLNPRRPNFPIEKSGAAREQITWEFLHLRLATHIAFWFPCESLCPIALYELGAWTRSNIPIMVGVHPDYSRRRDIEIQTALARPDVRVVTSLDELARQIRHACLLP